MVCLWSWSFLLSEIGRTQHILLSTLRFHKIHFMEDDTMATTIEKIRNDLKTLRLYYSAQAQLDKAFTFIPHCTTELVKTYSEMIGRAPLELYMLYMELYVNGNTQESVAEQMGYCTEYIRMKNKRLLEFFYRQFNDDGRDLA